MNKQKDKTMPALRLSAVCAVLAVGLISVPALAQVDYALMVQQTPVDGGSVTPDVGVHSVSANGAVTVTAMPKPGYQFVYWLGDVADPAANSTVVSLNAPKIVVAVFQRSEYELPFEAPAAPASSSDNGGGGGGLVPNRPAINGGGDISASGVPTAGGYSYPPKYQPHLAIPATTEPTPPVNVPPPVPNPEPATMLLLGIGSLFALKRKK